MLTLSIVIPAYNERERLPVFISEIREYCDRVLHGSYEVIVVDDGSSDGTWEWLQATSQDWPLLRALRHSQNEGKGAAIRTGVAAAGAEYILFADADGATPISEEHKLRGDLARGAQIAIGTRELSSGSVDRDVFRRVQASVFRASVRLIVGLKLRDTQCGFKMLTLKSAQALFPLLQENGFLLDIELLLRAREHKFTLCEHSVSWSEKSGSKVRPIRDSWRMFIGLWRLRVRFSEKTRLADQRVDESSRGAQDAATVNRGVRERKFVS